LPRPSLTHLPPDDDRKLLDDDNAANLGAFVLEIVLVAWAMHRVASGSLVRDAGPR
jgi:hypothetical protein